MRLRYLWLPIIALMGAGCGEDELRLEKGPFLFVDRDSLGFDQEFGSGTYVGATTYNSLYIENRGDKPLELTEVIKTGPNEFTVRVPEALAEGKTLVLQSRQYTSVEVAFKPSQAKTYTGTLTLKSNAGNSPLKDIALSGKGVPPP